MKKKSRFRKPLIITFVIVSVLFFISCFPASTTSEVYDASNLRPITKQELLDFLVADATNETTYNRLTYNCGNFAVDLWRNAYLKGFDAFIILLNWHRWNTHAVVGFYASEEMPLNHPEYWGENPQWFFVDPQFDMPMARGNSSDPLDKCNWEIITFVYGKDAFNLWKAISGNGPKIPWIKLGLLGAIYKIKNLF